MKKIKRNIISLIFAVFFCFSFSYSQDSKKNYKQDTPYFFKENKGQWHPNVKFKTDITDGAMFIENTGITYSLVDKSIIRHSHSENKLHVPTKISGHVVRVKFNNANENAQILKNRKSSHYENYFIGNDKSKWASEVRTYNEVIYKNIYNNIDFKLYEHKGNMKYDFILAPKTNPANIELVYQGADKIYIENGNLYIKTTISDIIENKPFAYQIINGIKMLIILEMKL